MNNLIGNLLELGILQLFKDLRQNKLRYAVFRSAWEFWSKAEKSLAKCFLSLVVFSLLNPNLFDLFWSYTLIQLNKIPSILLLESSFLIWYLIKILKIKTDWRMNTILIGILYSTHFHLYTHRKWEVIFLKIIDRVYFNKIHFKHTIDLFRTNWVLTKRCSCTFFNWNRNDRIWSSKTMRSFDLNL